MNRYAYCILILMSLVLPVNGSNPDFYHKEGVRLGEQDLFNRAIEMFDKSISIYDAESARAYYNRGWAYQIKGEDFQAIENYKAALIRNPRLVIAGSKLGYLYYKTEDYVKAVETGEHVINIDPSNRDVPRWLPDAYIKRLREEKLLKDKKEREEAELRRQEEEEKIREKKREEELMTVLRATLDFTIRTGYNRDKDGDGDREGFEYISTPGMIVDLPNSLRVQFTPVDSWEFRLIAENPHLGGLTPDVTIHSERLDLRYTLLNFTLGSGIMFNHYKSDIMYGSNELWDLKAGVILGYKSGRIKINFELYPRLFPHDNKSSTGRTYDTGLFLMDYRYSVGGDLEFYSIMEYRDYYLFKHSEKISSYWGVYDTGIGLKLGNISPGIGRANFSFSVEYISRIYLEDIDNDNPYSKFANGQGFFGMNKDKWLKGNPFSGYKALGHVLGIKSEQLLSENIFVYQRFSYEIADHSEFNLTLGIGFTL